MSSAAMAVPAVPPAPVVSAEEASVMARGEVAFRYPGPFTILSMVEVDAPPDKVIEAVIDLPPRIAENRGLISYHPYADRPGYKAAKWEVGVSVYTLWLNLEYVWDTEEGWCSYGLDETKSSDMQKSEGWYRAVPYGTGSRLFYLGSAQGNYYVPEWLRKRASTSATVDLMMGMKHRAESSVR